LPEQDLSSLARSPWCALDAADLCGD